MASTAELLLQRALCYQGETLRFLFQQFMSLTVNKLLKEKHGCIYVVLHETSVFHTANGELRAKMEHLLTHQ